MHFTGERQVAADLEKIRADHRYRYRWAAQKLKDCERVIDAACGVGYGSTILADDAEVQVLAFDKDNDTIQYAKRHWRRDRITYVVDDLYNIEGTSHKADALVCFEAIEHLVDPVEVLERFHTLTDRLLVSVPNEVGFPFVGYEFHVRHYTPEAFRDLLATCGWEVQAWFGQEDAISHVEDGLMTGRTLIAEATAMEGYKPLFGVEQELETPEEILGGPVPESVAIVAMGGSRYEYVNDVVSKNWGHKFTDEVWAVNAMGGLIKHDRLFHQDDLHIQQLRAEHGNEGVGQMLDWMKKSDKPIYTSRPYDDWPTSVEYPLEWVLNQCGFLYHTSTIAYALTFAIAIGVKEIWLYGADFSYPSLHKREQGRGCIEFWLGVAATHGIEIKVPQSTTLLDAYEPMRKKAYGYDTQWVTAQQINGRWKVVKTDLPPEGIPTAEEIELRYSHHPQAEAKAKHLAQKRRARK